MAFERVSTHHTGAAPAAKREAAAAATRTAAAPAPLAGLAHGAAAPALRRRPAVTGRPVIRRMSVAGSTVSTGMYASDLKTRHFPAAGFSALKKALDGAGDRAFADEAELVEWLKTVLAVPVPASAASASTATTTPTPTPTTPTTTPTPAPALTTTPKPAAPGGSWRRGEGEGPRLAKAAAPSHPKVAKEGATLSVGEVSFGGKPVRVLGKGGRWDEHVSSEKCLEYLTQFAGELKVGKSQKLAVGQGRVKGPLYGQILYDFNGKTLTFWHAHDEGKMG